MLFGMGYIVYGCHGLRSFVVGIPGSPAGIASDHQNDFVSKNFACRREVFWLSLLLLYRLHSLRVICRSMVYGFIAFCKVDSLCGSILYIFCRVNTV